MLHKFNLYIATSFIFLLAVVSANAQTVIRAHIPFDFYINNHKLVAGDYSISKSGSSVLLFQQRDGKSSMVVMV